MNAYGVSRRPGAVQLLVAVVMVDQWPIGHHVFRGNLRDATTVPQVVEDLEERFGLERVVFVGARGMVTAANLQRLREHDQGYVVGLQRRRREDVYQYIERATGPWTECPVGRTAREKATPPQTRVQEVASAQPGVRIFVVHSDERLGLRAGATRAGAESHLTPRLFGQILGRIERLAWHPT